MTTQASLYAVNVADLTGNSDLALTLLIAPVIQNTDIVDAEPGRFDGMACRLDCDKERTQALIEVVRIEFPRHQLRFYQSTTGKSWERI